MERNEKAQGTIEYLIILAIIVVIALVVVTLLLQFTDAGRGIRQSDSERNWKGATPFAIVNHVQSDSNLTIILKNMSASTINFVKICVNDSDCNSMYYGNVAPSVTFTRTINGVNNNTDCISGTTYSFTKNNIFIDYNNSDIAAVKKEQGAADLIGTCSE